MTRNWIRTCNLVVSGSAGSKDLGQLRVVFKIQQWSTQSPNMAHFTVYNVSPTTRNTLLAKEYTKVDFYAGYQDNNGLLFSGDIMQSIAGHETAVDTTIDIYAADGQYGYNNARVTKTHAAGYKPQDKWDSAMDALKPFGITMGLTNVDLSSPVYPRGIPLAGMARSVLRQVALSAGALWSIQQGQVHLIDFKKDVQSDVIKLDPTTGLVGWPRQTPDGIYVTSLLNPKLQPHMKIQLDASQIIAAEKFNNPQANVQGALQNQNIDSQGLGDGTYTIFQIDRQGDSRGGLEWYDISTCVGSTTGAVPTSTSQQGYSVGPN